MDKKRCINNFYWNNIIFSSDINKCIWSCRIQIVFFLYDAASWGKLCWPLGQQFISRVVYYLENATQPWNSLQQVLTSCWEEASSSPTPWRPKIPHQDGLDGADPLRDAEKTRGSQQLPGGHHVLLLWPVSPPFLDNSSKQQHNISSLCRQI